MSAVKNGREAYIALKTHYLGDSFTTKVRNAADKSVDTAFYDGRSRSFTFERYCETLKAAFTDIEATGEAVSETRKIRALLNGIKDIRLATAISQVHATKELKETFETACNFISQFADERDSYARNPQ